MAMEYTFKGWLGLDKESAKGKMVWQEFEPKKWTEDDVDIQVQCCGICGSDLHTLSSGWGPTAYPCCVGHEIVGKAVRVGKNVKKGIRIGDRVGVGAQSSSCLQKSCPDCSKSREQYCRRGNVVTYASKYRDGSGKSYGGYATHARHPGHFVFKIPDGLPSSFAAPMLCGGVTVYSPLKHHGCGPGSRVAVIGLGGLGHFAVLFAKALGAERVIALSRRKDKEQDALALGADAYIATDESNDWHKKYFGGFDIIICTVSSPKMPLSKYLALLDTYGTFVQVGAPEDRLPAFNAFSLITKGAKIAGSSIGGPTEIDEMLALAVQKNIKPWVVERPMRDANATIVDMESGKARYRYVLVNENGKL